MPGLMNTKICTVNSALAIIKAGGVVVFPTETAYGLAADATNPKAVQRIFLVKGRTASKSLPLIAADLKMVEKYAVLSPVIKKLVKKKWPGPFTVVVPVRTDVGANGLPAKARATAGHSPLRSDIIRTGTIAIRVSGHPIARELSRKLGRPIVSTSANLSGQPTCYSVRAVKKQLGDRPDGYIDVGSLPHRKPSTIVMEKNGEIIVLRGVTKQRKTTKLRKRLVDIRRP